MRVGAVGAGVLVLAATASAYFASIRPARRFLEEARRTGLTGPAVEVVTLGERPLGTTRPTGVRLETAAGEVRDVAVGGGRTVVATGGGAVLGGGGPRLLTTLDGLADVDLRAAAPFADGVALGGADGRLTLIGPTSVRVLRIGDGPPAPVSDLRTAGGLLYVSWLGRGAVALAPGATRARALDAEAGGPRRPDLRSVSALAVGPGRYALGTLAGEVHVGDGQALRRVCEKVPGGRVMALAFDGEALLVGTPLGLAAPDGRGGCPLVVSDLFVTALEVERPLLYVGTFDDGVHVLDRARGPRRTAHLLPGRRVDRLRSLGGAPEGTLAAIGPGGAHALSAATARPLSLPRPRADEGRLAGPHVTALLRGPGGRLYVGTFEHGIDVFGPGGDLVTRLPRNGAATARQVNALGLLPDTGEVAVATVRGLLVLGPGGERRVTVKDGLAGDEVSGLFPAPGGTLLCATNRGLTVLGPHGARTVGAFHGLGNNHTYAVAQSGRTTFVGTLGGLTLLRDLRVQKTLAAGRGPLRGSWVTALAPAREPGAVWVGLNGGGLARVTDEGVVESVAPDEPGFHVSPGALAVDAATGAVVAGTIERGAVLVEPASRAVRRLDLPLPSQLVTAVLLEEGAVHFGTDRGLVRVPREALGIRSSP